MGDWETIQTDLKAKVKLLTGIFYGNFFVSVTGRPTTVRCVVEQKVKQWLLIVRFTLKNTTSEH